MWPIHLSQHPASTADLEPPALCALGKSYSNPTHALHQLHNLCKTLYFEEVTELLTGESSNSYLTLFYTTSFKMIDGAKVAVQLPREVAIQESFYALVQLHGALVGTKESSVQYITYGKATPVANAMDACFGQSDDKSNSTREVHIDIDINLVSDLRLGSASSRSFKVPIQGIPHRARGHMPLVHIPFPGRTCIRLFSSDVLASSL